MNGGVVKAAAAMLDANVQAAPEAHSGYASPFTDSRAENFSLGLTNLVPELFSGLRNARSGGSEVLRGHHGPE